MTDEDISVFLKCADSLLSFIQNDGSIPYSFDSNLHGISLKSPWYSAMVQGQVLSVFARAFSISKKQKYIDSGEKVFNFMITACKVNLSQFAELHRDLLPYKDCGIYEEYVANTNSYVLNGNLFGLIGIHDWYKITGNKEALDAFNDGCKAIEVLLPYYDFYGHQVMI